MLQNIMQSQIQNFSKLLYTVSTLHLLQNDIKSTHTLKKVKTIPPRTAPLARRQERRDHFAKVLLTPRESYTVTPKAQDKRKNSFSRLRFQDFTPPKRISTGNPITIHEHHRRGGTRHKQTIRYNKRHRPNIGHRALVRNYFRITSNSEYPQTCLYSPTTMVRVQN